MLTYQSSVSIDRTPEVVFPYFAEPSEVTFGMGPLKARIGLEITELEVPRRMAWTSFSGPIRWAGHYDLEAVEGGTRVSQQGTLTFSGLWRLFEPLIGAEIRNGEEKELEKLKALVEAS